MVMTPGQQVQTGMVLESQRVRTGALKPCPCHFSSSFLPKVS